MITMSEKTKTILAVVLLIFFLILIGIGMMNGEMQVVFDKAKNICLECIGIG